MGFRVLASASLALLLHTASAAAQGGALSGVRGQVLDSARAPVPQAVVTLRHTTSGQSIQVTADGNGRYLILNRPPGGPYVLTAERIGFASTPEIRIQLLAGTVHPVDIVLGAAVVALPSIEVRSAADSRFGAERTGAATVLDREAVLSHPTIQRDVMELVARAPMAARTEHGFAVAGQNTRYNSVQIDGARFQDLFGLGGDGVPGGLAHARPLPLQAVEQFQVLVAPFDVRHSGFTGGLLNAVTRAGTNEWEVTAFGHYRDRHLLGDLELPNGVGGRPARFENAVGGVTVGGPLVRDRAHIFVALELEQRTAPSGGYSIGHADPFAIGVAADSMAIFSNELRYWYNYDTGSAGELSLGSSRDNVFLRGDWLIRDGHRLVLRHNYAAAERDIEPNRAPTGAYELGSQLYQHDAVSHASTVQLVSSLPGAWSNELMFNLQRTRDRSIPTSTLPMVEVSVISRIEESELLRTLRAGGHFEAQSNELRQSSLELRNTLTGAFGTHLLTLGGSFEVLNFDSRYVANPRGLYRFASLQALRANQPTSFERTLTDSTAERVDLDVGHFSLFLQDEWNATSRLTLRGGIRADLPVIRDEPVRNEPLATSELAVNTARLPATRIMFSPRFGFNWLSTGRYRTQVRGGIGLFTGRPSYSWLASAFAQTGVSGGTLTCFGDRTPGLNNTGAAADACLGSPLPSDIRQPAITAFADDFQYPQDLRIALGFDRALPWGMSFSTDAVYARALRQIHLRDLNLVDTPVDEKAPELGHTFGYGYGQRNVYGVPTTAGFEPRRRSNAFGQVIELGEKATNRALAVSAELGGNTGGLRWSAAYTFTRAIDSQSLVDRDAATNLGNTAYGTERDPVAAHSDFDRPHRVVASLATSVRTTDLSLFFTAESGAPYTYVYAGDINGDGYPGTGTQDAFNDPVYVINDLSEFPGALGSGVAYTRMIGLDRCLGELRGGVLNRNECRAPATYRLDLRAAHALRINCLELRLVADILNVLHLFGSDRGTVQRVDPLVPLLQPIGRRQPELGQSNPERLPLDSWYVGGRTAGGASGLLPYSTDLAASRWQAQIGIEVRPLSSPR